MKSKSELAPKTWLVGVSEKCEIRFGIRVDFSHLLLEDCHDK